MTVGSSSTLLLVASERMHQDNLWIDSLDGPPQEQHILAVTLTDGVDQWIQQWRTYMRELPASLKLVTADTMRGAAATNGGGRQITPSISVQNVSSPGDLTGLGIAIDEQLSALATTDRPVVWFDSLTVLLQYADVRQVFRLLHTLLSRFHNAGADVLFHLDPAAHDTQTVATLRSLFDSVVTPDAQPAVSRPPAETVSPTNW